MSEYCREQHPLLCEEASEEEHYSPRYYPRVRPSIFKGRNRNNLKGAAAILARWPDHWASFLTYWWIGIGMATLTTFIIYNTLFAFSMLPSANMSPARPIIFTENGKTSSKNLPLPEIYLHIFVDQNEVVDLNQYLPYVETISDTFLDYKFHFIIVVNDTNLDEISAAENNEKALNMLLNKDVYTSKKECYNKNINIEHVTLSTYMDNSPLQKYWRTLPHQLIEFVARTVSIWEKGGVAFNPNILTPRFQHALYIEKLQTLLNKYAHTNKVVNRSNISKVNKTPKKHRKLNNIRDIIDAMENEDISGNPYSQQKLSEAETNVVQSIVHEHELPTATDSIIKNYALVNIEAINKVNSKIKTYSVDTTTKYERLNNTKSIPLDINSTSTKMNLIPSFLDFLFHNRGEEVALTNRTRKNAILTPNPLKDDSSSKIDVKPKGKEVNINSSEIVSVVDVYNTSKLDTTTQPQNKQSHEELEPSRLTIDLKGNIIATDTPCHAFLGTIFSNIVHHSDEETITDFIIAELSIFCRGLLTSCMGIDLILL